jgi:hypothetical protein
MISSLAVSRILIELCLSKVVIVDLSPLTLPFPPLWGEDTGEGGNGGWFPLVMQNSISLGGPEGSFSGLPQNSDGQPP